MTIKEGNTQIQLMLGIEIQGLAFLPNWDSIIQAVEFIESKKILVYIQSNNCKIQDIGSIENKFTPKTYIDSYGENKKDAVFNALSKFSKLYNQNKL